jgi:RecB family exonuclease
LISEDESASLDERKALASLAQQQQRQRDAMSLAERQSWIIMQRLLVKIRRDQGQEVDENFEEKEIERDLQARRVRARARADKLARQKGAERAAITEIIEQSASSANDFTWKVKIML